MCKRYTFLSNIQKSIILVQANANIEPITYKNTPQPFIILFFPLYNVQLNIDISFLSL
jgi:hypothetical protein